MSEPNPPRRPLATFLRPTSEGDAAPATEAHTPDAAVPVPIAAAVESGALHANDLLHLMRPGTLQLAALPPQLIVLIQLTVGTLALAPFAGLATPPASPIDWLLLATLGLVHTGLMSTLLYGAIQKIPTALVGALSFIYPAVVGVVSIGIVIFLLGYVVPQVVSAFSQARQDLPGLTLAMPARRE